MPQLSHSDLQILQLAYTRARRVGLGREDAQDCAQEFRVHLLRTTLPSAPSSAWLTRCAHNYACNYLRSLTRRQSAEQKFSQQNISISPAPSPSRAAPSAMVHLPGPRTLTLRKVFWDQLLVTLQQFTPDQRSLFLRYHIRQQSLADISKKTGRTAHALQQSLYQVHGRLSKLLLAQGWSVTDIRELFGGK